VITLLGIPLVRIAQRLNIHRETISKYAEKTRDFLRTFIRILKVEPLFLIRLKNDLMIDSFIMMGNNIPQPHDISPIDFVMAF